ncbi:solute carrier family 43 member 3 [Lingula anatina]|uniref:Solute carrier family 43 member 3 n=1 Tax=Lingula anatina TaxID=7574 RepID=A0A1S3IXX5_LINAN|nr:solute carrier family 43 member 3 [Lingula anatina]XP_013402398.1 solute carrier family 43 member 3 [Lingula anatina]XP_013402399.1 solute carrier family 43 member 3 [Lingula anatina]XP_013402400.1 solute carrier family 43 member 3 [Lingula anatina]|eukprot:XP_013402397.1 solute carrier family 43 member 3 [Lingula anatina]
MSDTKSTCTKILIVAWVICEVALYTGLIDGWTSLVYVLKSDGYFSSVCKKKNDVLPEKGPGTSLLMDYELLLGNSSTKSLLRGNASGLFESPNNIQKPIVPGHNSTAYKIKDIYNSTDEHLRHVHYDRLIDGIHRQRGRNFSVSHIEEHCLEQEELLNLVFTIGVFSMVFAPLLGILYDKYGCTTTRIVSLAMLVLGIVLLAFSAPGREWLLYPCTVLLSMGGQTLHLTDFQVAPLFAQHESTIATLVSGAYDTSATTFLLVKLAYDSGFSLRSSALSLAASASVMCAITTFILPQKRKDEEGSLCQRRSLACRFLKHLKGPNKTEKVQISQDSSEERSSCSTNELTKSQSVIDIIGNAYPEDLSKCDYDKKKTASVRKIPKDCSTFTSAEQTKLLLSKASQNDQSLSAGQTIIPPPEGDIHYKLNRSSSEQTQYLLEDNIRGDPVLNTTEQTDHAQDRATLTLSEQTCVSPPDGGNNDDQNSEFAEQTDSATGTGTVMSSSIRQKIGENAPFKNVLKSPIFMITQFWLIAVTLLINVFIGIFNSWIEILSNEDMEQVSHFTNVFGWMQVSGIVLAPLAGIIVDKQRNRNSSDHEEASGVSSKNVTDMGHFIPSFALTNVCAMLLTIGCTIPVLSAQYATMVFFCLVKPFAYGVHAAFLACVISRGHFGKSYTLQVGVIEVTSWLQFPLFTWFQGPLGGNPLKLNLVLIAIACLTFVQPLYIWIHCRRRNLEPIMGSERGKDVVATANAERSL